MSKLTNSERLKKQLALGQRMSNVLHNLANASGPEEEKLYRRLVKQWDALAKAKSPTATHTFAENEGQFKGQLTETPRQT